MERTLLNQFILTTRKNWQPLHLTNLKSPSFIKTFSFAFLLATIPSFHGFYMKGGALEVGKASTTSFVWTSVAIIVLNYFLTQMLLS